MRRAYAWYSAAGCAARGSKARIEQITGLVLATVAVRLLATSH